MPIGVVAAGIGAAGAIGGALISSNATSSAANATSQAANTATQEQAREYNQSRTDMQPWLTAGTSALGKLSGMYGVAGGTDANGNPIPANANGTPGTATVDPNASFYQSPDYQFNLSQGIKGVDAGAAATGSLDSGATRKAEIAYAGNLASSQYNSYVGKLQSLAGVGQSAANSDAQTGSNYANQISNIATNQGNNLASSYLRQGQIGSGALGQLGGIGAGLVTNMGGSSGTAYNNTTGAWTLSPEGF